MEDLHPATLKEIVDRFEGKDEAPFVSALILRSMKRARYTNEAIGHYALSERHYTHFTSPIRRYPDLVVHRKLRSLREQEQSAEDALEPAVEHERLGIVADHCSETERRAERAERELRRWRLVRLLESRIGETLAGRATGVEPFGVFIELEEYFVDGLLALRDLEDDFYVYDPELQQLVGRRRGRVLRLADRLKVKVLRVDPIRRLVDLGLAGAGSSRGRRERPKREDSRRSRKSQRRGRGRRRS